MTDLVQYRMEVVSLACGLTIDDKHLNCDSLDLAKDWFRRQVAVSPYDNVRFVLSSWSPNPLEGHIAEVRREQDKKDVWSGDYATWGTA